MSESMEAKKYVPSGKKPEKFITVYTKQDLIKAIIKKDSDMVKKIVNSNYILKDIMIENWELKGKVLAEKDTRLKKIKAIENYEEIDRNSIDKIRPIHLACICGDVYSLSILLDGVNIKEKDGNAGLTPLMWAAKWGRVDIIYVILEYLEVMAIEDPVRCKEVKSIVINMRDNFGYTALIHAAGWGFDDVVKLLIENGADIDMSINAQSYNAKGKTAIIHAAKHNRLTVVEELLINGADINKIDKYDNSTLIYLSTGLLRIIKYLSKKKIRLSTSNKDFLRTLINEINKLL